MRRRFGGAKRRKDLVPCMRPDRIFSVFSAKLPVIVHYLPHQILNHLLSDDAILLARQFCDCHRDRINDVIGFIVRFTLRLALVCSLRQQLR